MKWNYWKCIVRKNGSLPGRSRKKPRMWLVVVIETGRTVSQHNSWKKAVNNAIFYQKMMNRKSNA
jgi:hypothetical protein